MKKDLRKVEKYHKYLGTWRCIPFNKLRLGDKFRLFDDGEQVGECNWIALSEPYDIGECNWIALSEPCDNKTSLAIDVDRADSNFDTQILTTDGWEPAIPEPYSYTILVWLWKRFSCWRDEYGRKAELFWE